MYTAKDKEKRDARKIFFKAQSMTKYAEKLGNFYQMLCDAQLVAQELQHPCLDRLITIREEVGKDVLKSQWLNNLKDN